MDGTTVRTVTVRSDREVDALVGDTYGFPSTPPCFWQHRTDEAEFDTECGWSGWCYSCGRSISEVEPVHRRYTSDPVACSALKKKLREQGWMVTVKLQPGHDAHVWLLLTNVDDQHVDYLNIPTVLAPTEERAVALAALRAHGIDVQYEAATLAREGSERLARKRKRKAGHP